MTDQDNGSDQTLLAAALLAQTGTTKGPAPTDEELESWLRKTLTERRRSEVESHIAHSPQAFERAMLMLEQGSSTPHRTTRWPTTVALAATAVIAVAGLTTMLGKDPLPTARDNATPTPVVRSASRPPQDWRRAAFVGGFQGSPRDRVVSADQPGIDQCLDGDDCVRLAGVLYHYGALLAQLERTCASGTAASPETRAQFAAIAQSMAGSFELAPWQTPLRQLTESLQHDPDVICARIATIKQRYQL